MNTNDSKIKSIRMLAKKSNINLKYLESYGKYKAKISLNLNNNLNKHYGKLILVTSINPTKYGEGKTTQSIGILGGLCKIGKKATASLREPSLGPVFGIKGGATGAGKAKLMPDIDINLHFNGDIHAIESANNLLCAIIDNHIFQGNNLDIQNVCVKRCLDVNDRALRNITIESSYERKENFNITAASEIMAIITLAKDFHDLKYRLGKIIVGYNSQNKPIFVSDLNATDALAILLKDAIKPNLVQTLENNLVFVHGGPFANIAHGSSSVISINMALSNFDYCITEAGFGSDLGGEKFFDIVVPHLLVKPSVVVLNVTIRALKHNGLCPEEKLEECNLNYLKNGISNLDFHLKNMQQFSSNILVVINKFLSDDEKEIDFVKQYCIKKGVKSLVSNAFLEGGNGTLEIAKEIVNICQKDNIVNNIYDNKESIMCKIDKIAKKVYTASKVNYTKEAIKSIKLLEETNCASYPLCIAKTPLSITDDSKKLGFPQNFEVTVKDVYVQNGAEFIVVLMGNILTMPGLGKDNCYEHMIIDDQGRIKNLR